MKHLLTILILITSSACFAQTDSTDTVKQKKWAIKLTEKQQASIANFDAQVNQLQAQFQSLQAQKDQYIRAILDAKDVDVTKIQPGSFKYENGKLIFIETK